MILANKTAECAYESFCFALRETVVGQAMRDGHAISLKIGFCFRIPFANSIVHLVAFIQASSLMADSQDIFERVFV